MADHDPRVGALGYLPQLVRASALDEADRALPADAHQRLLADLPVPAKPSDAVHGFCDQVASR